MTASGRPAWRSPIALVTGGALVVAALVLATVVLANQSSNNSNAAIVTPPELAPASLATGYSLGKASAPVKIDIWADLQCPYCGLFTREVEPRIISQFVEPGTAQLTFKDYAFIGSEAHGGQMPSAFGQDESVDAAIAARCAGAQGQGDFWHYQEYLYWNQGTENGGKFNETFFDRVATKLGLNVATFNSCLTDPAQVQAVVAQTNRGKQAGVTGTPTLFINGQMLQAGVPTYDQLAADIQAIAAGKPLPSGAGASQPVSTVPPSSGSPAGGSAAPASSAPASSSPSSSTPASAAPSSVAPSAPGGSPVPTATS